MQHWEKNCNGRTLSDQGAISLFSSRHAAFWYSLYAGVHFPFPSPPKKINRGGIIRILFHSAAQALRAGIG